MTAFADALADDIGDVLRAPICIIGAGAAGITLARRLSELGKAVLLVESGSANIEGQTQALYLGENVGARYYDLAVCRLRYFGGTTNHWSGYCRSHDPIDFEGRADLDKPAWPVALSDLEPYIASAAQVLGVDTDFFDPAAQLKARGLPADGLLDARLEGLETKNFQLSKNRRLGPRFRDDIAADPRIRPVEHLNATQIVLSDSGNRVSHVEAATLSGKTVRLEADTFVLCCHAIENARLLLASDAQMKTGIGNAHDHVGRYFMDHLKVHASRFVPSPDFPKIYNKEYLRKFGMNANLSLTPEAMRAMGTLSYYCRFNPEEGHDRVFNARTRMRRHFWQPASQALLDDIRILLSDPRSAITPRVMPEDEDWLPRYYNLEHRVEQASNPASRVTLGPERDKLGMRTVRLDWQLSELDVKTLNAGQNRVARELGALGLGRFELEELDLAELSARSLTHYHHMGTTRMAARAEDGVVDPDLKVFGIENLYVAGSGVYPTAGYGGPTMMLMGLSLRLAEHLAGGARG